MKQAPKDDKEFFDKMSDQEFLRWMRNFADKLPAVLEDHRFARVGGRRHQG